MDWTSCLCFIVLLSCSVAPWQVIKIQCTLTLRFRERAQTGPNFFALSKFDRSFKSRPLSLEWSWLSKSTIVSWEVYSIHVAHTHTHTQNIAKKQFHIHCKIVSWKRPELSNRRNFFGEFGRQHDLYFDISIISAASWRCRFWEGNWWSHNKVCLHELQLKSGDRAAEKEGSWDHWVILTKNWKFNTTNPGKDETGVTMRVV